MVTRQLQVDRGTGKVRLSKTDVFLTTVQRSQHVNANQCERSSYQENLVILARLQDSPVIPAVGSHGGSVFTAVCLSVYTHDISKTDAARITKFDTQMFHGESWKSVYFKVKMSRVKFIRHKTVPAWSLHSCQFWFLLVAL